MLIIRTFQQLLASFFVLLQKICLFERIIMKKIICIIALVLTVILPASAVLKEKNLDNTLNILRGELTAYHSDLERQTKMMQEQQQIVRDNLMDIYYRSSQNSLMLYSQNLDYIFDLTYACHEATEMYMQFQQQAMPFRTYIERNKKDIARYDSLVTNLSQMSARNLSEQAQIDRNVCLTLAVNIRRTLNANSDQMEQYINYYDRTEERLRSLNDYAQNRYHDIQSNIFINGDKNYFEILKDFNNSVTNMKLAVTEKYRTNNSKIRSQWDVRVILMLFAIIILYGLIAIGLNVLFIRFALPKRFKTEEFLAKKLYITMATSVVTLAIILGLVRMVVSEQNFLIMASGLMVEYAWLLGVILISLLLRLEGKQIGSAVRIYAPLIFIGFIVIAFRIVLIPNHLVNLIFPPILLICTIWQYVVITRHNDNIPKSDVYYTYISLLVFIVSVVFSWLGYTLFAVQALIWWVMQLTCVLTITCISGWMQAWAKQKHFLERPITETWFYEFCASVVLPMLGVGSIVLAIYWAADVFNLSDTTWEVFRHKFIDTENFSASIFALCQVVVLYFFFAYVNRSLKELLAMHFEKSDHSTAASRNMLAKNIIQIIVWGLWLLICLNMLNVSTTWLAVIMAGLSTGIGFASKDILENIYYGVSLMAGRVKIGDLIECDGYRGTVSSISYTSTMLSVADGSVIAFQNSQLFTKNYKNLTKNHGYELDKLEVGVAYGTDIDKVRALLVENISKLPFLEKGKPVTVVLDSFGDSSVNIKILVWVPVITHYINDGEILECIYKTLNDNNIEIPFPQIDVHKKAN